MKPTSGHLFLPHMAGRPACSLVFSPSALPGSHSEIKPEVPPVPRRGKRKAKGVNLNKGELRVSVEGPPRLSRRARWDFQRVPKREPPGRSCLLPTPTFPTPPPRPLAMTGPEGGAGDTDAAQVVRERPGPARAGRRLSSILAGPDGRPAPVRPFSQGARGLCCAGCVRSSSFGRKLG